MARVARGLSLHSPLGIQERQTVYTYFRQWRKDGTWVQMHDRLREWIRIEQERHRSPSEAVIDSQSVKSAAGVSQSVGYDAGKQIKGRKRFMTVDTLGLVLRVLVTAASVPEREGAKQVLKQVKQMGQRVSRLHTIWADGGFDRNLGDLYLPSHDPYYSEAVGINFDPKKLFKRPLSNDSILKPVNFDCEVYMKGIL